MNISAELREEATAAQAAAAYDSAARIRLVAGPGAGKSAVIRKRVLWLLRDCDVSALALRVVSFTNASTSELRQDIADLLTAEGLEDALAELRVTTLHSLSLAILSAAGRLSTFAVEPRVLSNWETEGLFDPEFGVYANTPTKTRQQQIRRDHEALWSTGGFDPAGYPVPEPPVQETDRDTFLRFYTARAGLYGYVLPSEINRQCLDYLRSAPSDFLPIPLEHLIVDEYQDLNPVDLELVAEIASRAKGLFVSGDDDQSVYFFRYALPEGIQRFVDNGGASDHRLRHCFRCGDEILQPALALLAPYAADGRIPKDYIAVPSKATPVVTGQSLRWAFDGPRKEADAIARSCLDLVEAGVPANRIAILLSTTRDGLEQTICESLTAHGVPYEPATAERFCDSKAGRCLSSILRVVVSAEDYVALRTLLVLQSGVGPGVANEVARACIAANMRYGDLFEGAIDRTDANGRAVSAVRGVQELLSGIRGFTGETLLGEARGPLMEAVCACIGEDAALGVQDWLSDLADEILLGEVLMAATATSEAACARVLRDAMNRAGIDVDDDIEPQERVRVLTLHRSKGLTVDVAFVPGLEEGFLPSAQSQPYAGLIAEQARLLYVGLTRARAAVVQSYAHYRSIRGELQARTPSRFTERLGRFENGGGGLSPEEIQVVLTARDALSVPQEQ